MYRDARLSGFDAAAVVEVVQYLDQPRLRAFERVLFEAARPGAIVLTTPNAEYNVKWPSLPAGQFRHQDHRFEWTRTEFLLPRWTDRIFGPSFDRWGDDQPGREGHESPVENNAPEPRSFTHGFTHHQVYRLTHPDNQ